MGVNLRAIWTIFQVYLYLCPLCVGSSLQQLRTVYRFHVLRPWMCRSLLLLLFKQSDTKVHCQQIFSAITGYAGLYSAEECVTLPVICKTPLLDLFPALFSATQVYTPAFPREHRVRVRQATLVLKEALPEFTFTPKYTKSSRKQKNLLKIKSYGKHFLYHCAARKLSSAHFLWWHHET